MLQLYRQASNRVVLAVLEATACPLQTHSSSYPYVAFVPYVMACCPRCQVVPPSLAGRAALFGQRLDLPPNWHILDAPYFAAPGLNSTSILTAQGAGGHTNGAGGGGVPSFPPALGDDGAAAAAAVGRVPGRTRSDVYPLVPQQQLQQQQQLRQMRCASFTQEGGPGISNLSALTEGGSHVPTSPAAAAAAGGALQQNPSAVAAAGAVSGERRSGDGLGRGASMLQSLSDAPRRLSSGNETDVGAAAAAAMAAAGPQADGSSATLQQQQQQQHLGSSLARLQSCSTPGVQQHLMRTSSSASQQQQQQQGLQVLGNTPTAAAGSSSSSSYTQSLLVLRAASLQLNVAPSVLMAAAARGDRRGPGGQRARLAGPARPLFPLVTILFASVEGSGELLRFPALARSVQSMLHHLMLQLLRSFPGSYLVRAQQGDLKYMLAFTNPAAAVGWGLTLQEAAL